MNLSGSVLELISPLLVLQNFDSHYLALRLAMVK